MEQESISDSVTQPKEMQKAWEGNVQCREASVSDLDILVEFQVAMAMETEKLQLQVATCTQGVLHVFKNPNLGTYYIASLDQKVIGCLLIIPEWSDWRNKMVWWVHSVYVLPSYRALGVFSKLYSYVQKKGILDHQIRGLRLYVDKRNVSAQKAYEKLGMSNEHYELYEWMRDE